MKKNITILLIFVLSFFLVPLNIYASYDAMISATAVRVREGAGTGYKALYSLSPNTPITVVDKTKYTGTGCSKGWYKVIYDKKEGYVCSSYITFIDNTFEGINVIDYTARVHSNNVSVRKTASTSATKLDTLTLGTNVTILSEVSGTKNDNCSSGKWYNIRYNGNATGYMCKNYITKKEDRILENEEYTKMYKELGFPDSYIPYLNYLHQKYPNWQFIPKQTGLSFAVAVDSEEGKNYIQNSNPSFITSTKPAEGSSWYKANSQVIAFYMDPRNWLTEERIFMFEKQDFSTALESQYPTLVKAIFGSGKLGGDEYTIPMINAGKANKISPLLIATRIRLEVGANGSDSTNGVEFTWKGQKYKGYYNFFNIGAYEVTIDGVEYSSIVRGLAYAAKLINREGNVWDNIETAIKEGSSFLANGYVNNGQGTLYYQKFNVSPDSESDPYTHQYMTNIQAPATEGNQTYNSYKKVGILNESLIFEIPIYNNMPSYTSLPNSGDVNNDLKALQVKDYTLSPTFDKDVLSYEVYVPTSTTKVTLEAITDSTLATISGIGEIEVPDLENTVTITVKSQVGEEKKYQVTIKKVDDTTTVQDVITSSSMLINDNYITEIKNNTKMETLKNNLIKAGAKSIIIKDKNGKDIENTSTLVGTGQTITINTAIETQTFTISVNGDTSGDGLVTILDLLEVQKHIKKAETLKNANLLSADTSGDNKVTILDLLEIVQHIKKYKLL